MQQFRVVAACSAVNLALAIFLAHSAYGLYLDLKLGRFVSGQLPPKRDSWDRSRYPEKLRTGSFAMSVGTPAESGYGSAAFLAGTSSTGF